MKGEEIIKEKLKKIHINCYKLYLCNRELQYLYEQASEKELGIYSNSAFLRFSMDSIHIRFCLHAHVLISKSKNDKYSITNYIKQYIVEHLATRPEADLVRRLRINHAQFAIAAKEKKEDVCELLNIMERILIEAQLYKADNNIPDVPTEMELEMEEMELMIKKEEEREKLINPVAASKEKDNTNSASIEEQTIEEKTSRNDKEDQLSLF